MANIRSLAKDTAVYGLSSILGRFLNWILVPLYVYLFPASEYGIVSYLYSFTAVALVILNYGMETGFFRFANRHEDPEKVYTTSLWSVGATSLLFIILLTVFLPKISSVMLLPKHPDYVWLLGVTVAIDAFANLPFAYLRYKNRAWTFAGIKFLNIGVNIFLNVFFILICPRLQQSCPGAIDWFYSIPGGISYGIGWIFVANIISTIVVLIALLPFMIGRRWKFDPHLLAKMLDYSWPLLILGVAGIASQNMGQLMIPYLFKGSEEAARTMVGIYGANIKIAVVMVMFTQAFRYAYEPFIFAQARAAGDSDRSKAYCDAMKYFVIFGLLIFLGVMYFLPLLKYFISPGYWSGLRVVPVMMMADLFFGVYFNLALWYKLTDRTRWGMYMSLMCFALMFLLNLWLVPAIGIPDGYMGSAWAAFISYGAVMVFSYFVGRRYYPLPYEVGRMCLYALLAVALYYVGMRIEFASAAWLTYTIRILLLGGYLCVVAAFENIPVLTPAMRRLTNRR
ncbi:MAG: oligosaccharide flippase family protein [Muribaculaceae bacterium]|nr:oligosaccharide flippase family protein [Muribaculaceae bacterium]